MRNLTRGLALAATMAMIGTGLIADVPVALAGQADHFEIFAEDAPKDLTFTRFFFPFSQWQFGDRPGYTCAWGFLMNGGVAVARVQLDRGQDWVAINDKYGVEHENDGTQCIPEETREVKQKPSTLGDTIVAFNNGSSTLASMTFPATSAENAEAWWELEDADSDEVELELYWHDEVVAVATLTALGSSMSFSTRSAAPPSIASFAPATGGVGSSVTLLGANFVGVTSVTFNGLAAAFEVESGGELVATVPAGATAGPITVTTPAGSATTAASFTVDSTVTHAGTLTLGLRRHLIASGALQMLDGSIGCLPGRTVVVERRVGGIWMSVGTAETGGGGAYRAKLKDKSGRYRARVEETKLVNGDTCLGDVSKKSLN